MFRTIVCLLSAAVVLSPPVEASRRSQAPAPPAAQVQPQTPLPAAEKVVAMLLQAKGGLDRLKALTTARMTGRISAQGAVVPMSVWAKRPNLMRREVVVDNKKILNGFDGTTAWATAGPSGEIRAATGPQVEIARSEAEFDNVFVDYVEKGHSVELVGRETINGRAAYHLRLTRKNGQAQSHYVDAENGQELRVVATVERGGTKVDVMTEYSDYREVDGITLPFTMRQSVNGTPTAEVVFEKIAFNVPIEDTLFKMPGRQ